MHDFEPSISLLASNRTHVPATLRPDTSFAIRAFTIGSLALLAGGCGGDPISPPTTDSPIPAYAYVVDLTAPTNTCATDNLDGFKLIVTPRQSGASYTLEGLFEEAIPATKTGDRLQFSAPTTVDSFVVTFEGDWLFSGDRHTFTGTTDLVWSSPRRRSQPVGWES